MTENGKQRPTEEEILYHPLSILFFFFFFLFLVMHTGIVHIIYSYHTRMYHLVVYDIVLYSLYATFMMIIISTPIIIIIMQRTHKFFKNQVGFVLSQFGL